MEKLDSISTYSECRQQPDKGHTLTGVGCEPTLMCSKCVEQKAAQNIKRCFLLMAGEKTGVHFKMSGDICFLALVKCLVIVSWIYLKGQ